MNKIHKQNYDNMNEDSQKMRIFFVKIFQFLYYIKIIKYKK